MSCVTSSPVYILVGEGLYFIELNYSVLCNINYQPGPDRDSSSLLRPQLALVKQRRKSHGVKKESPGHLWVQTLETSVVIRYENLYFNNKYINK